MSNYFKHCSVSGAINETINIKQITNFPVHPLNIFAAVGVLCCFAMLHRHQMTMTWYDMRIIVCWENATQIPICPQSFMSHDHMMDMYFIWSRTIYESGPGLIWKDLIFTSGLRPHFCTPQYVTLCHFKLLCEHSPKMSKTLLVKWDFFSQWARFEQVLGYFAGRF